eukprot:711821-Hanusia_phi.AAC.1
MLPYHPNPLPSCRPAEDRGARAGIGRITPGPSWAPAPLIAAQTNTRSKTSEWEAYRTGLKHNRPYSVTEGRFLDKDPPHMLW